VRFLAFPKISTTSPAGSAADKGTWLAQEKIHGAQLVAGVAPDEVRIGKRKAWLEDGDAFFGWQLLRSDVARVARAIRESLRLEATETLYVYGELFGGAYPHPDVAPIAGLSAVQTGIWYAPDLRWAPFDAVISGETEDFAGASALAAAARDAGAITPPVLARGRKTDVSAAPFRFETRVPALLGLPRIDANLAEGIVIKPEGRVDCSERAVVKRKIEEFDDAKFGEAEKWDAAQDIGLDGLLAWVERLVNPARIASARSKAGESAAAIRDEVVLDVTIDLETVFPVAMRALSSDAEERLRARIADLAARSG
jgi:Rnl2 family RNA ligase